MKKKLIHKIVTSRTLVDEFSELQQKTENVLLELLCDVKATNRCDKDALQHVYKQAISLKSTFLSLINNKNIPLLESKFKTPANKKIEVQRKFFSTKKRKKVTNIRLVKPTSEEKEDDIKRNAR